MTNEYEKLELFYIQSTFIKDFGSYIKSRDDFALIENIHNIIKLNSGFDRQDLNKIKDFYEEYFKIKNVFYYPEKLPVFKHFRDKKIKKIELISPFDVPISFYDYDNLAIDDRASCSVEGGIIPYDSSYLRYVKKLSLTITKTILESYAHEIAHTQQTFLSGENDELFPIFIELLFANHFDRFNLRKYLRLNNVLNNLEFIDNVRFPHDELLVVQKKDAIKYAESTLKAFMLYFIYTNEQLSSKKAQIIDDIQDCFDNKLSIKEFLNRNDIKEDNYKSLSLIRQYFK